MSTTNLGADDLERMLKLSMRILADHLPKKEAPLAAAYVFSETDDNDESSFAKASRMLSLRRTRRVFVCGTPWNGYSGPERARKLISSWSIFSPHVETLPVETPINTLSEARTFVQYARDRKLKSLGIIAPPFHLVRSMFTTVTAMRGQWIRVYAFAGESLPWNETVLHSQGKLRKTRYGLLGEELARLEKYRAEEFGSMAGPEEMEQYFAWRDGSQ